MKKTDKTKKSPKTEKEQNPSFFSELGGFMKPYYGGYALSVITSIAAVALSMCAYAFTGLVILRLFSKSFSTQSIFVPAAAAVLAKILSAVLINVSTLISHKAAYHTLKDIRWALADKMLLLPLGFFEKNGSGRLKAVTVDRIESAEKTLAHMIPELTADISVPLALIVWMFFIDWRLALIVLLWIVFGLLASSGMMKNYEQKYRGQIRAFKNMNQAVVEFVNGIEVIKNFGRTDSCSEKYEKAVYDHASYNVDWQKETQKYTSLSMALAPFSVFPLLIAGLIFYSRGTLDAGTLFMMIILSFGVFGPIMNASSYFDRLAGMGTDAKEIKDILDCEVPERSPEKSEVFDKSKYRTDIEYSNVCFSYDNGKKQALKNISFVAPENGMTALVGPSGSGKSTVAKLFCGYYDFDSGDILIGGKSIRKYSVGELNRLTAFVDQDTFLFDKSIADNIRIGSPNASDEEVINAARKAGCDEFIRNLPDGYNTRAGDAGKQLSGGEKQRIAIARAMMKDAPILILDEATASTDPENEAEIGRALSAAAKGKTVIVIAHRLSAIKNANQIVFINDGKVQSIGTHEELMKNCEEYARMRAISEANQND